jgi:hypothetical protein
MLKFLLIIAMIATVSVLIAGFFNMFRPNEKGKKLSNKLMVWRVWLQGLALIIFAIILYAKGK